MMADVQVKASPAILVVLPGSFRPDGQTGKAVVEQRKLAVPLAGGAVALRRLDPARGRRRGHHAAGHARGRGPRHPTEGQPGSLRRSWPGLGRRLSRPVVDQGWLPPTRQVGKSGMTVKPKLYLALGISGVPEHSGGHEGRRVDYRREYRPQGADFRRGPYGAESTCWSCCPH